jgi:hypothetical protein
MISSLELYSFESSRAHVRAARSRARELGEHRRDRIIIAAPDRAPGLLLGDQDLVHLLAGPDAGLGDLDRAAPMRALATFTIVADGTRGMTSRRAFADSMAASTVSHGLVQAQEEARHLGVRDGHGAARPDLLVKSGMTEPREASTFHSGRTRSASLG